MVSSRTLRTFRLTYRAVGKVRKNLDGARSYHRGSYRYSQAGLRLAQQFSLLNSPGDPAGSARYAFSDPRLADARQKPEEDSTIKQGL